MNSLSEAASVDETLAKSEIEIRSKAGSPSRVDVHLMFDRIARHYDLLNRLLSFGQDVFWRRRAVSYLAEDSEPVLDLACGTCDLALVASKRSGEQKLVIGLDMAPQMLRLAHLKMVERDAPRRITLIQGDGGTLPFHDGCFGAVMIAFGIRNMVDTGRTLGEMYRVLKPGGRAIVLEFSQPHNRFLRAFHTFHLRLVVPLVGGLVSGDRDAYRYLDRTIEAYHQGEEFLRLMSRRGFGMLRQKLLTFGVATIYVGEKP